MNMKENVIVFPGQQATQVSREFPRTRALAFKIKTKAHDFAQYVRTVKAYALAKMPFRHIANAGEYLGDEVISHEVDAPLQAGWQNQGGGLTEDTSKILAWQTRGEKVSLTAELPAPVSISGQELVIVSNDLTTTTQSIEQTVDVVEGINVSRHDTPLAFPNSDHDWQLENSRFFQPRDEDLKKAA